MSLITFYCLLANQIAAEKFDWEIANFAKFRAKLYNIVKNIFTIGNFSLSSAFVDYHCTIPKRRVVCVFLASTQVHFRYTVTSSTYCFIRHPLVFNRFALLSAHFCNNGLPFYHPLLICSLYLPLHRLHQFLIILIFTVFALSLLFLIFVFSLFTRAVISSSSAYLRLSWILIPLYFLVHLYIAPLVFCSCSSPSSALFTLTSCVPCSLYFLSLFLLSPLLPLPSLTPIRCQVKSKSFREKNSADPAATEFITMSN